MSQSPLNTLGTFDIIFSILRGVSCQGQSQFPPLSGGSSHLARHIVVPVLQSYDMSVVTAILVGGTIVAVWMGALKIM